MMPIGSRPVLWHVMRYYAHFGHTEFVLCLGYGAQAVKDYFLDYRETASNDFVLTKGGVHVEMLGTDISDWTITFIDTGIDTAIGERLRRVRPYLEDDEFFLANYGDVLTDAPLNDHIEQFVTTDAVAQFLSVSPQDSFHVVNFDEDGYVTGPGPGGRHVHADQRGVLRAPAGDLRLPRRGRRPRHERVHPRLRTTAARRERYDGFWAPMDTLKERNALEQLYRHGVSPWALSGHAPATSGPMDTTRFPRRRCRR